MSALFKVFSTAHLAPVSVWWKIIYISLGASNLPKPDHECFSTQSRGLQNEIENENNAPATTIDCYRMNTKWSKLSEYIRKGCEK